MVIKKKVDSDIGSDQYVKWFSELSNKDISIAGGKGASLAEMYNAKFPVPPGFMITAQSFDQFIKKTGIGDKILSIINSIKMEDTEALQKKSREIRDLIEAQKLPKEMESEILEAYHILGSEKIDTRGVSQDAINILKHSYEPIFVSVRSSATTEDLADASFAGQQESFLNVKGDMKLIENVKKCFSSLYTPRAIYYRHQKGFDHANALLSVVVMKMVDSQKSGVMFTRNPVGDPEDILIESVFGLGEGIVSGQIKPDDYIVSRDLQIKDIKLNDKKIAFVRTGSGDNGVVKLSPEKSKSQVMTNGQIVELANYGLKLEKHYGKPQDVEFAIDTDRTYIVQSRPITTLGKEKKKGKDLSGNVILNGLGSSPGVGIGTVKIIKSMNDLDKIKKGDVLVTEMTNPDMVVAMERSVAIVTDEGGITAHASIVSRELGIPCVVGTEKATSTLKDGMVVTVDGTNGKVYEGKVGETTIIEVKPALPTNRVRLKVIVDMPESAERASKSGIEYVGLTRLEGIIASFRKHPLYYEKNNSLEDYTKLLSDALDKIAAYFKSMWIRSSDIRTDEFSDLEGAPAKEMNPMLGLHGIRFSLKHPRIFEAELAAIKKVALKYPEKTFGIMFPQVILIDEVKKAKEYFNKFKTKNMEFGVMIETPAAVQIIEDICREGVNFISFGTNDLTQFTLAVDREEEDVQYLYNELNPAIFYQIKRVIGTCRRYKVQTSICGQAGSKKEMAEFLFRKGINSISVNADAAYEVSKLINDLEAEWNKSKPTNSSPNITANNLYKRNSKEQKSKVPVILDIKRPNIEDFETNGVDNGEDLAFPVDNLEDVKKDEWMAEKDSEEEAKNKIERMHRIEDRIEVKEEDLRGKEDNDYDASIQDIDGFDRLKIDDDSSEDEPAEEIKPDDSEEEPLEEIKTDESVLEEDEKEEGSSEDSDQNSSEPKVYDFDDEYQ
ncbi:Phosphoenolpyruvate synthase [uncultured archaeon]|nr:Phosphoenolpyruvate synthase [uncultured archaeon]